MTATKGFLITHKPQPISGADRALVWFGQRPTLDAGSWSPDRIVG